LNIGGPSIHVSLLSQYFHNNQFQTKLVSGSLSENEGDMSYLLQNTDIEHIHIHELKRELSFVDDIKSFIKLFKLFQNEKPDIVHTHMAKAGMVGRFAAFLSGVPSIYHTFHGHVFSGYFSKIKTWVFIWIERLLALLSSGIIVISKSQKQEIAYKYRITSEKKISVIPLGFDLEKLQSNSLNNHSIRQELKIPEIATIIGIVGRITQIKNHDLFLDVASKLIEAHHNFHFLIVGDGELRREVEDKVRSRGLSGKVHFAGWISNPADIYSNIDILLLTSKNEGTPVAVIEAMFFKKPVIASAVGGVLDIIEHEKNGFIVDSFNPDDFIKFILQIKDNLELRIQIGENGNKFVKSHFSKECLFENMTNFYNQRLITQR